MTGDKDSDRDRDRDRIQQEWINGIVQQIEFANKPDVLPDYFLQLKIVKRRSEP